MELLAGLEPATSTYDHPSAAAALGTPVSKRRALPFELQEQKISDWGIRIADFEKQLRAVAIVRHQSAIRNLKSAIMLVGEDRIELSPRVPRTRMLALHHTPMNQFRVLSFEFRVA